MSIQRPIGLIGHCSAKVRRLLEIEEEEALGRTVRVKAAAVEEATSEKVRGNRWSRPANFRIPGAFHTRFVSAANSVTFHFSLQAVSKTADGGCMITTPDGTKRLVSGAPAEHDGYIDRPGAVMTIEPAAYDGYADRAGAVEASGEIRAVRSNIADTAAGRQRYWRAVHEHERTPGSDRLSLVPEHTSRGMWLRLADDPALPDDVRAVAAGFAKPVGKRKTRTLSLDKLEMGRKAAAELCARAFRRPAAFTTEEPRRGQG